MSAPRRRKLSALPRPHAASAAIPFLESLEGRSLMSGNILEVDVLPLPVEAAAPADGGGAVAAAPFALGDTFQLNSVPGANHTIYLDFDGHVTSGTIWNSNFTGNADIVTPAFDTDGNAAAFSDAELERIQYIWQRVAEDFAPFNVNVSTTEPGAAALTKSGTGDTQWGVRVVIGGDNTWYGGGGGVAYVGSFNWNSDTPTFVFEANLGNGNEKYTAEAISHEAGHTLGLSHDGRNLSTGTEGYYEGHGSGATGWAPIMGVGYYKELTQWSKGEYPLANQTQDDLAIITSNNGFGYRADLVGNTTASATALSLSGSTVSGAGIIERTTDVDFFSFTTGAGTVSLSISPFTRGPNLDILARVHDSGGNIIATSNPTDALNASFSLSLPAGQYYLSIDGAGKGDLTTGYSDYGSLGQYTITGTIVPPGPALSVGDVTVNESAGTATFTVSLSQAAAGTVTVDVATANGSALAGDDYTAAAATLTFAPGELTKTFTVAILDDAAAESTETFTVNLSNADGAAVLDGSAAGTITDNDVPTPTLAINNASVNETNPAKNGTQKTTTMTFTVTLSAASATPVTVQYATAPGTATAGVDYVNASGTLTFNPGEVSKTISVQAIGDTTVETNETLFVNLSNATGANLADGQGLGTIVDNDSKGGGGGRPNGAPAAGADLEESPDTLPPNLLATLASIIERLEKANDSRPSHGNALTALAAVVVRLA